jgi:predicted transcriptional regulator
MSDPTSIRIPADLKRDLQKEARREDRTLSMLIILVLRQWLAWKRGEKK